MTHISNLNLTRSAAAFDRARKVIPGGVNSPVRAYGAVGGNPPFIRLGKGSRITDIDANEYIDYVCSWGPLILGHADPDVVAAVQKAAELGSSFGAPTESEVELAQMIVEAVPSVEKVRLVNSGTEAVMSAIRLARGFTGRTKIVKFEGCYHGHSDSLLIKAGSGAATFGVPTSPGVPPEYLNHTIVLSYNDFDVVEETCRSFGDDIACIIVEPIAGNMGVVPPADGYLQHLRRLSNEHGIVLIFDEVISGFRAAYGGAQEKLGVTPDLTTLGKIIGGGLPVGAYGGRAEIMSHISPEGPVYQAGTLSGNPLATAAGLAVLKKLKSGTVYEELEAKGAALERGLTEAARKAGVHATVNRAGSVLSLFFTNETVTDFASAAKSDTTAFGRFFRQMLNRRIYLAPSQFEGWFISAAHSNADIDETIAAAYESLQMVQQ